MTRLTRIVLITTPILCTREDFLNSHAIKWKRLGENSYDSQKLMLNGALTHHFPLSSTSDHVNLHPASESYLFQVEGRADMCEAAHKL